MKRNSKGGVAGIEFFCALEARRLLASSTVVDGVLQVNGTSKNDVIVVGGAAGVQIPDGVTSILVNGGRGNDVITVDSSVNLPTKIYGSDGDDTITGGFGADRIIAGDGNDVVYAGNAKDIVYGEAGDDYLRGGSGTDLCDGGDGRDTIIADTGNDHLWGGANPDNLRGGVGDDDLHGGGGLDGLHGEAGDDFLAGDRGVDHLFPGPGDNTCDASDEDFIFDAGLTTSGGATLKLTPTSTYIVGPVPADVAAKLDIVTNKIIIDGEVVVPRESIGGLIHTGRNGGNWNGSTGIVTTQTSGAILTAIGIATAQQVKPLNDTTVWAGQTVSGTDTLVMYTYGGDANLDGKINVDDYGKIDFTIPAGTSGWYNGDFNYDGKINADDYGIIDFNIGTQGAAFPTGATGVEAVGSPTSANP